MARKFFVFRLIRTKNGPKKPRWHSSDKIRTSGAKLGPNSDKIGQKSENCVRTERPKFEEIEIWAHGAYSGVLGELKSWVAPMTEEDRVGDSGRSP